MVKLTFFGKSLGCIASLIWAAAVGALLYGYVMNIVYLFGCDFEPSYKAEIFRCTGIFVAPLGIILGFLPNAVGK